MKTNDLLKLAFMRGVLKADVEAGISLQDHMTALEKNAAWWTMPVLGALGGGALGALAGGPDAARNAMWGAAAGGLAGGALKGALAWRNASIARQAAKKALEQAGKAPPKMGLGTAGLIGAGGLGAGYLLNQYLSNDQQQPQGMPMGGMMPQGMMPQGMMPQGMMPQGMMPQGMMDPNMQQSVVGMPPDYGMSYPGGY